MSNELDAIRARAAAATEGPWNIDDEEQTVRAQTYAGPIMCDMSTRDRSVWEREDRKNAEFIAHARTDVPRLLAALDAVSALHQEDLFRGHLSNGCKVCAGGEWPCETARTITTALEGTK